MPAVGLSAGIVPGGGVPRHHGWPGRRSAGVGTRSSFATRGTLVNCRGVIME
jgi:hypothetical protein